MPATTGGAGGANPATSRVNVATLEQPLDTLEWADGGTLAGVQPFSLRMYQMHERLQRDDAPTSEILALLRLCVPDGAAWTAPDGTRGVVDEDYRLDLSGPRVFLVFQHAQYKLRQAVEAIEDARKNGVGAAAATDAPLPPSAPTTSSSTPSPASPARSPAAGAGGTTRTRRSTKSSIPSTV